MISAAGINRFSASLIAVAFVASLWLPLAGLPARWDGMVEIEEKRSPAPPPAWGKDPLRTWPDKFLEYFRDNFGLRRDLLYLHNWSRVKIFRTSSSERVILGKDKWLFYTGSNLIDDFQGLTPFSETELDRWRNVIEGRQAWLAERGIRYLFVMVPNKVTIYPEYLPDFYHRKGTDTHADQLAARFARTPGINYLDLRPILREAGHERLVYYPYETHWNHYGAYLGYREIGARLREWFPGIEPFTLDDFDVRAEKASTICHMLGIRDKDWGSSFAERFHLRTASAKSVPISVPDTCRSRHGPPVAFEKPDKPRRLLVFHDSFLQGVPMQALSEHFGRSVWLWLNLELNYECLRLMVDRERPDVVIEQRIERFLKFVPEDHEVFAAARRGKVSVSDHGAQEDEAADDF